MTKLDSFLHTTNPTLPSTCGSGTAKSCWQGMRKPRMWETESSWQVDSPKIYKDWLVVKEGGQKRTQTPPQQGVKDVRGAKMKETKNFRSTNTKKIYKIKQAVNCDSDYVIYLVTCGRCQGQYVGKSKTPFKRRHSNHKCEIKRRYGGLGHHYGGSGPCSYEDLSITIIERVETENMEDLAERELYWQHQLRAYVQNGGKAHCYRKDIWFSAQPQLVMKQYENI